MPAAAAQASSVTRPGDSTAIGFFADPGETNDVTIDLSGSLYVFTDAGAPLDPDEDRGCVTVTVHTVTCPARPGDVIGVVLGDGDDRVAYNAPRPSVLCGEAGNDTLQGGPDFDLMLGSAGDDHLSGGGARDFIEGEGLCPGSFEPPAPPGVDHLDGGDGGDRLEGGAGRDVMDGGPGVDTLLSFGGNDVLDGGAGDDALSAEEGDDELHGGEGRDILCGGDGADEEHGGPGGDEVGVSFTSDRYSCVDLGSDKLYGDDGDDTLEAGPTSGFLLGGSDLPLPGPSSSVNGADLLQGGQGRDTVNYAGRTAAVSVSLNGRADDGSAGEGDEVADDVEAVVGGDGDDSLSGGARPDRLDGGAGADALSGGGGDDALLGGVRDAGADRLAGEEGADALDGGPGPDRLDGGPGGDKLAGAGGDDMLEGGVDGDALTGGPGLDELHGGPGDDDLAGAGPRMVGADGDDRLVGGAGTDTLAGGPGDDVLAGGPGPDRLAGEAGERDAVDYRAARSAVTVSFDGRPDDGEAGESDNVGTDVERLVGSPADETATGTARAEVLQGSDGEDHLADGGGRDVLSGGAGGDALWARDGDVDRVACGRGRDLAVVDAIDRIESDCEHVDAGDRRPRVGRRALVRPVAGTLALQPPGADRLAPQPTAAMLDLPVRLDARRGIAAVTLAGRRPIRARLSGGRFTLGRRQVLLPPGQARCRPGTTVVQRLRARTRGRLQVRAAGAVITATRAEWTTTQRCHGTRVTVSAGVVRVRDLRTGRQITLRAGRRYLARHA